MGKVITSYQNTYSLSRHGTANFADIVKITIMLIKTTFKESIEVIKDLPVLLDIKGFYFLIKMLISSKFKRCVT